MANDKYLDAFIDCHDKCRAAFSQSPFSQDYNFELYPYLYSVFSFRLACRGDTNDDCMQSINEYLQTILSFYEPFFYQRLEFYVSIANGDIKPRGDWLSGMPIDYQDPLICMFTAFGDILINPECSDDYENAPLPVCDFSSIRKFSSIMIDQITPLVSQSLSVFDKPSIFHRKAEGSCKQHLSAGSTKSPMSAERIQGLKEKLSSALGWFGYVIYIAIITVFVVVPISTIGLPRWVSTALIFLCFFWSSLGSILVFAAYIWGLVVTLDQPIDTWAIIFFVVFAVWVLARIVPIVIVSIASRHDK